MSEIKRPNEVKEDHLIFLDELRKSGVTNMYGAAWYLMEDFPLLSKAAAQSILWYWMQTFADRHLEDK